MKKKLKKGDKIVLGYNYDSYNLPTYETYRIENNYTEVGINLHGDVFVLGLGAEDEYSVINYPEIYFKYPDSLTINGEEIKAFLKKA